MIIINATTFELKWLINDTQTQRKWYGNECFIQIFMQIQFSKYMFNCYRLCVSWKWIDTKVARCAISVGRFSMIFFLFRGFPKFQYSCTAWRIISCEILKLNGTANGAYVSHSILLRFWHKISSTFFNNKFCDSQCHV